METGPTKRITRHLMGYIILFYAIILIACSFPHNTKTEGMYRIPFPSGKSIIEFPLNNFKEEAVDEKIPWYFFRDSKSGLNLSFNIEPTTKCYSGESCRDYLSEVVWPKDDDIETWRKSKLGEIFIFEWMLGPIDGFHIRQHHMHANYFRDGCWVDIHLSKVFYNEKDRDLFLNVINSITIK